MALVKCTECGNDVSTKAAACPNCGAPPTETQARTGNTPHHDRVSVALREGGVPKAAWVVGCVVVAAIALNAVRIFQSDPSESSIAVATTSAGVSDDADISEPVVDETPPESAVVNENDATPVAPAEPEFELNDQQVGSSSAAAIIETYRDNPARFTRDFKGKQFVGVLAFSDVIQNAIFNELYHINLEANDGSTLSCTIRGMDAVGRAADMNAGERYKVVGTIDDVTFGNIELERCQIDKY